MKIKSFKILKDEPIAKGLVPGTFEIRSNIVALVGRNGSGKSRMLDYIFSCINNSDHISKLTIDWTKPPIRDLKTNNNNFYNFHKKIRDLHKAKFFNEIHSYVKLIKGHDISNLSKQINFDNSYKDHFNQSDKSLDLNEFELIDSRALSYFLEIPHRLAYEQSIHRNEEDVSKTKVYEEFKSLQTLIKDLIGKNIEWGFDDSDKNLDPNKGISGIKGKWLLDNWPFEFKKLSDGEKSLFVYALLLHLNADRSMSKLKESIILIDEPEQHLHPEALIGLINGLKKRVCQKGQIWLATHSLTLLSELDYRDIHIMENGKLQPPSYKSLAKSIDALFGLQERSEKLKDFISNSHSWAYTNFILQSFEDPEVIESSNPKDPQFQLFLKVIKDKEQISILDFGAGKGRIGKLLNTVEFKKLQCSMDAYDIDDSNAELLKSANYRNLFLDENSQITEKYDFVILSNTLHEIDPDKWAEVFDKIKNSLNPEGLLIFIEDLELPKGEKIDRFGFLTLNEIELGYLLNCKPERIFSNEKRYKERILCTIVSKNNINKVTKKSIQKALKGTKLRSFEKSKELRKLKDIKNARLKAFYDSLYINTNLALEYYNGNSN